MFDAAKLWRGFSGRRRMLVKVLVLNVVLALAGFLVTACMVIVAAAMPSGGFGSLTALQSDPVSSLAMGLWGIWILFGVIALLVTLAAWKGMTMKHRVAAIAVTGLFFALILIGAVEQMPGGPATNQPGTGTPLLNTFIPTADTTASYPASPFTACTSQSATTSNGQKTAASVVSTTMTYQSNGALTGQFNQYTGDQVAVTGGGGKMTSGMDCFQMKISWQYTNAPSATGGGSVYFPVYVYLTSITYSAAAASLNSQPFNQQYNNGTAVNVPIFGNSLIGLNAFPVLVKDAGGNWLQVCPNLQNVNVQYMSSLPACSGINVNTSPTSNTISFTVIVDLTASGPFGYATTDGPTGNTFTLNFAAGLPQSQALPAYPGYYSTTLSTWSLNIVRTTA